MATPAQRTLYDALYSLLNQLGRKPHETAAVASFLQVHAADLKGIMAAWDPIHVLRMAASVGHPDVIITLFQAMAWHARAYGGFDLYSILLHCESIYDLNGDELDDAGIAERLRTMTDAHGVQLPPSEFVSDATSDCVQYNRLECLRVMLEIDPLARGYTREDTHDSLLHVAAKCCQPRMVRFLLENGWSLTSHDENMNMLSPVGVCLLANSLPDPAPDILSDMLDALLRDVDDAPAVLRSSGLCATVSDIMYRRAGYCNMPHPQTTRMILYVCAAAIAPSSLPMRILNSCFAMDVINRSPSILRTLPLDEHVCTGIGDSIYLRDTLRVASSFDGAARHAATVDVLCIIETRVNADPERWRYAAGVDVLRDRCEPVVSGASPTLRCWAWMRRLHAVTARQRMLQREAARRT